MLQFLSYFGIYQILLEIQGKREEVIAANFIKSIENLPEAFPLSKQQGYTIMRHICNDELEVRQQARDRQR